MIRKPIYLEMRTLNKLLSNPFLCIFFNLLLQGMILWLFQDYFSGKQQYLRHEIFLDSLSCLMGWGGFAGILFSFLGMYFLLKKSSVWVSVISLFFLILPALLLSVFYLYGYFILFGKF